MVIFDYLPTIRKRIHTIHRFTSASIGRAVGRNIITIAAAPLFGSIATPIKSFDVGNLFELPCVLRCYLQTKDDFRS